MNETRTQKGGRPAGSKFPRRLLVYMTDKGMEQLQAIADRWETSQADVVRRLVRERAQSEGLEPADE